MWQWMVFLTGFGLTVAGGTVTITYLNFVPAGLTWIEFLYVVRSRPECYLFGLGLFMIIVSLLWMKE
ncbi:hypothetical protein [Halobacillus massiliensis]|uniref:hypothetical protein n=1 Tax=Halobacillus massiliensis TaxID=1926286 RepID=UPI0009E48EA0|nr:hypothetical protein [Halobacillus massiliensis]